MPRQVRYLFFVVTVGALVGRAAALETVKFEQDGKVRTIEAELLVEAQDGGMMLQTDDGRIWTVQPEQIREHRSDDRPLEPLTADEMERRMLAELPSGFAAMQTNHYLILYDGNAWHAKEVAAKFEQLYNGFYTYWDNQQWDLPKPRFPLVALVFANQAGFQRYAREDIGEGAQNLIGYYHLGTNRMTTFNVPNLERNIATIIHEATHQLAYNCGLQQRFADNPMWVSEGLATYFESPDMRNPNKWRHIGRVNHVKLSDWRKYLNRRPADSLVRLLTDDERFRDPSTAADAYAECWALTYFLIRTHKDQYVEYLKKLSKSPQGAERSRRERIAMFEDSFGKSLREVDRELLRYMRTVRGR